MTLTESARTRTHFGHAAQSTRIFFAFFSTLCTKLFRAAASVFAASSNIAIKRPSTQLALKLSNTFSSLVKSSRGADLIAAMLWASSI
jgi:hypothetical protein